MRIWRGLIWILLAAGLVIVLWTMRATSSNAWDRTLLSIYAALQYDTWQSDALIVEIDDASLDELGPWPWPRRIHAQVIKALEQADVIVYDIAFVGETNSLDDNALVDAVAANGRVVLPLLAERDPDTLFLNTLMPFGDLVDVATLGHVDLPLSADGELSALYLKAGNANAQFPILSLAAIALQNYDLPEIDGQRPGYDRNTRSGIWVRDYANILLPRVNIDSVEAVTVAELLRAEIDPAIFDDKTVFVGLRSDQVATRVPMLGDKSAGVYGVDVQLQAYEAIKRGGLLKRSSNLLSMLLALFCFSMMAFALWLKTTYAKVACVFSALLGVFLLPLSIAAVFDIWLLQGFGLIACIVAALALLVRALQHYFGSQLPENSPAYDDLDSELMVAFAKAPMDSLFVVAVVEIDFFDRYVTSASKSNAITAYERIKFLLKKQWSEQLLALHDAGNYGFVMCFQFAGQSQFESSWQGLPSAIEQLNIRHETSTVSDVITVSAGAAAADVSTLDQPELLFGNALVAFKQALAQGRNQANIFH